MGAFCVSCGGKLDPGAKFCAQCGQTVAGSPATPSQAAASSSPAPTTAPPAKGGGSAAKIIFALLGVFTFFVLAAAGSCTKTPG